MITTLCIDGMRTVHCVRAVFTSLAQVDGIVSADVTVGRADLLHVADLDREQLSAAVRHVGYTLRDIVTERRRLPLHLQEDAARGEGA